MEVSNFMFPMDFIILDLEEDIDHPFILGMPFLFFVKTIIDVYNGIITLQIREESQTFDTYQEPQVEDICMKIEVMDNNELKDEGYIKARVKHAKSKEFNFKAKDDKGRNSIQSIQDIKSNPPLNSLISWCKGVDSNVERGESI